MTKLTLGEKSYTCQSGESVLDTLIREEVDISYACQQGTCHSCLTRSVNQMPPEAAQKGLKATQKQQKYFLAFYVIQNRICRLNYLISLRFLVRERWL